MKNHAVNDRAQLLLKALVERYIREGQPIGSRTLSENTDIPLSAATIRNVLADLEDHGYLHSPHTSAGRIPTTQGYRLFVDSLLTTKQLNDEALAEYCLQWVPQHTDTQSLLGATSSFLSGFTQFASMVTLPRHKQVVLRQVEFLPLSDNRVLVILVLNEQEVQNRIIHTDRAYSASELQQAANYLTQLYAGKELRSARKALLAAMEADRRAVDSLMQTVIDVAGKALVTEDNEPSRDYVFTGESNLLDLAAATGIERLRALLNAFTHKSDMLHLLDRCLEADGVEIFIGEESGYDILDACSVITAPYTKDDRIVGVVGVIGPTRMAYERVIPVVDMTAKLLSTALN